MKKERHVRGWSKAFWALLFVFAFSSCGTLKLKDFVGKDRKYNVRVTTAPRPLQAEDEKGERVRVESKSYEGDAFVFVFGWRM